MFTRLRGLACVLVLGLGLLLAGCASTNAGSEADAGAENTVEASQQEAVELLLAAIETFKAGDLDGAMVQLQQASDAHPGFIDPLLAMGDLEERRENWGAARTQYQRALEIDPTLTAVGVRIGLTFVAQERLDDAHAWLIRCVEADPGSFQAYYNLGTLCLQRAERSALNGHSIAADEARHEALDWYRLAAAIETRDVDAPARIAQLLLGFGDPQGALEAAEVALERADALRAAARRHPGARVAAGVIVQARQQLESAQE